MDFDTNFKFGYNPGSKAMDAYVEGLKCEKESFKILYQYEQIRKSMNIRYNPSFIESIIIMNLIFFVQLIVIQILEII